jgi:hypothetical protein
MVVDRSAEGKMSLAGSNRNNELCIWVYHFLELCNKSEPYLNILDLSEHWNCQCA